MSVRWFIAGGPHIRNGWLNVQMTSRVILSRFMTVSVRLLKYMSSLSMSWRHSRKRVSALTMWKVMLPIGELTVIDLIDDVWPMPKQA